VSARVTWLGGEVVVDDHVEAIRTGRLIAAAGERRVRVTRDDGVLLSWLPTRREIEACAWVMRAHDLTGEPS